MFNFFWFNFSFPRSWVQPTRCGASFGESQTVTAAAEGVRMHVLESESWIRTALGWFALLFRQKKRPPKEDNFCGFFGKIKVRSMAIINFTINYSSRSAQLTIRVSWTLIIGQCGIIEYHPLNRSIRWMLFSEIGWDRALSFDRLLCGRFSVYALLGKQC